MCACIYKYIYSVDRGRWRKYERTQLKEKWQKTFVWRVFYVSFFLLWLPLSQVGFFHSAREHSGVASPPRPAASQPQSVFFISWGQKSLHQACESVSLRFFYFYFLQWESIDNSDHFAVKKKKRQNENRISRKYTGI